MSASTPGQSPSAESPPRVVAIVGPTAVGKTRLSVILAEAIGGEIVSLDSRQMVRRLEIGTAKPTADERARVHHHLVDIAEPDEPLSIPGVQALALAAIEDIFARGRQPIVVGGTGQYVWAVVEGWTIPEVPPDEALRADLAAFAAEHGADALHARLAAVDPVAAAKIDARNIRRVIRALEVHAATGEPISAIQARAGSPYDWRIIGLNLPREALYPRIDARIDAMIADGLEDEVRGLVAAGYGFGLPAMSSVGYREWDHCLRGDIDADEVVRLIRRDTRRLVRMQDAWFKRVDPRIRWVDVTDEGRAVEMALGGFRDSAGMG